MTNKLSPNTTDRRTFVKVAIAGGGTLMLPISLRAADAPDAVDVWVLHGTDKTKLMAECMKIIDANGGLGKNTKKLALKVNAAWERAPELGANTHPELVTGFIEGAKAAGVTSITVPEHSCHRAERAFARSGIGDAVKKAGATMVDLKSETKHWVDTPIPKGKTLTKEKVARQFLEADMVVNMPVAKHHSAATLTMAMKNWMGAVEGRKAWHREGLHECIADFNTFIKPGWAIIDATRVMLHKGPQGGRVQFLKKPDPNLLIVSKDQVAADAYATRLFNKKPGDIKYLDLAVKAGIGIADLERIRVHEVEA